LLGARIGFLAGSARNPRTECCCQPVVVTVVRKRLKLKLNSKKVDGNRVYRIAGGGRGKTGARPSRQST
jgi:hypothetical protein